MPEKKKILFLIPTLMHGGAERVLVNLANHMDHTKYDVTIQTLFNEGVNKKLLSEKVRYISNFERIFRGFTQIMKIFSPKRLYRALIKVEYDVVVSFLEGPTARILAGCPYPNTKKIAWIHIEQHTMKAFARSFRSTREALWAYGVFDRIVCVSRTVKDDFDSLSGLGDKSIVLYNVNDVKWILEKAKEKVEDFDFDEERPVFCSVAKVTHTKGYERLAKIHKHLIQEGLRHRVIVIGTGESEDRIRKYCIENHIDKTFMLIGYRENPYKYVRMCDGYICSSYREGFSTAVTEALILGVPCISTNCSGAYELLGDSCEYGVVTENQDEALYQAVKDWLQCPEKIEEYREKAIRRGKKFSTEHTVSCIEKMFDEVTS